MAGRPPLEVTDEQCRLVGKLAGYGLTEASIAHCLGMHPNTFARHKVSDERIAVALEKGKSSAEKWIGKVLYRKALTGDLGAIVWWEKTRANRYERSRQELTGKDGGPIVQEVTATESPRERILGELDRLAARVQAPGAPQKVQRPRTLDA